LDYVRGPRGTFGRRQAGWADDLRDERSGSQAVAARAGAAGCLERGHRLARGAPLVILDEPTSALDAKAEHELFSKIGELFDGRSVLLISHRFSTVRSADRIYVLRDGSVVESGTHAQLMDLGSTYAELFTLQASPYQ
jgi:ATP-binding cassette subfamily B protein